MNLSKCAKVGYVRDDHSRDALELWKQATMDQMGRLEKASLRTCKQINKQLMCPALGV